MIRRVPGPAARAGITLTEILIAILIMGVGLVSLATLFPLGLLRLRDAQRYVRTALASNTAHNDAGAKNLLQLDSFRFSWYLNFPGTTTFYGYNPQGYPYTPWSHDNPAPIGMPAAYYDVGPGLPVAYDPLWWSVMHQTTFTTGSPVGVITPAAIEARFGNGIGFLRTDADGSTPSAFGLQRITNFAPYGVIANWPFTYPIGTQTAPDVSGDTFTSRDDIVMQTVRGNQVNPLSGIGSPLVPDLSSGQAMNDWTYTWMFTGYQSDVNDESTFDGSIVVFHNRPFGYDQVPSPYGGNVMVAPGERVVEGIFGPLPGPATTVILRWPDTTPDPDVRVGSWVADVTYERRQAFTMRFPIAPQRCNWYQVAKREAATASPSYTNDGVGYRQMSLTVSSPVQSRTAVNLATGEPIHVNAALLNPYVVNVFPKTIYVR